MNRLCRSALVLIGLFPIAVVGGAEAKRPERIGLTTTVLAIESTPPPTSQPEPEPTPAATPQPTPNVTPQPTLNPSPQPTPAATPQPTPIATVVPTPVPTALPSPTPTPPSAITTVTDTISDLLHGGNRNNQSTPSASTNQNDSGRGGRIAALLPDMKMPAITQENFEQALNSILSVDSPSTEQEEIEEAVSEIQMPEINWAWLTRVDPTMFNDEFYRSQQPPVALTVGLGGGGLGMILAGLGILKGEGLSLLGLLLGKRAGSLHVTRPITYATELS